jgi:hypothetical protein
MFYNIYVCVCVFVFIYCVLSVYLSLLFCSYFVVLCFLCYVVFFVVILVLCIFIFVCTRVGLLPPGESPIAVSNNNRTVSVHEASVKMCSSGVSCCHSANRTSL